MSVRNVIRELESARRKSALAIPVYSGMLVAVAIVLWALEHYFTVPLAVTLAAVGITALTLIGDLVNYYVCGRRLQKLRSGQESDSVEQQAAGNNR